MAVKQQIVIEVDDNGAIRSVEGLTDALDDNTKAIKDNEDAADDAAAASDAYAESLEKQEARIKVLDGAINLVGGSIEVFTGAMVLSGAVSEETAEKFEAQAIGAIALADGAKRVFDGYKTLSEGLKAYGGVAGLAQKAQAALNTTILANPYVAAAVALGAITVAVIAFTKEVDQAAKFQKEFDAAMVEAEQSTVASTLAISTYNDVVQNGNLPIEDREFALKKLAEQGVITEDVDLSNAESLQLLNDRTAQSIDLILARAKASAAGVILEEAIKEQLEAQNSSLEDNISFIDETIAAVTSFGNAYAFQFRRIERGAKNRSEAEVEAQANVDRATKVYQETLDNLVKLEGENVKVQRTVREELERRAKTDSSVKQALIDRANAEKEALAIYEDVQNELALLAVEGQQRDLLAIDQAYEERLEKLTIVYGKESEEVKALQKLIEEEKQAVRDEYAERAKDDALKDAEELAALQSEILNATAVTEEEQQQLSLQRTAEYYDQLIEQARKAGLDITELNEAKNKALEKQNEEFTQTDIDKQKEYRAQLEDLAINSAVSLIGDLKSLNQLFDQDNEEAAKRAFNREKALSAVETVLTTYLAASKAYASQIIPLDPTSVIRAQIAAGVAIAGGLARLAVINAQTFDGNNSNATTGGGATGGGSIPPPPTFTAPGQNIPEPTAPTATGSTLPTRTYVLAGDVADGLEANARLKVRRKL